MLPLIYKFLVLNQSVGIPGVGNFSCEKDPAAINGNHLTPPRYHIRFQPGSALTDRVFYRFLAAEKNVSEVDAVRQFQDFAYQLRAQVNQYPSVDLSGLGVLRKNQAGELLFESSADLNHYFLPLNLTEPGKPQMSEPPGAQALPAGETEAETAEPVKDRWWVWALVLLSIGVGAIVYYFMSEGLI
ncbi:MAG TPA: hypothetical protein VF145_07115 [Chitinophagaceae bacterium]